MDSTQIAIEMIKSFLRDTEHEFDFNLLIESFERVNHQNERLKRVIRDANNVMGDIEDAVRFFDFGDEL
ncbi:hypothetical protein [Francisella marina]|uniref:hypothetical protein n=1 Tax=Francisella marina TaxID=2249302 RepID=UPI0011EDE63A|nr:hypothetical protein [Francisella marina]QEO58294.1 hypothetical protein F0R75_00355 [Francisella marina]